MVSLNVEEEVDTAVVPPLLQYPTGGPLSSVIIGKGTLRMFLLQRLLLLITEFIFLNFMSQPGIINKVGVTHYQHMLCKQNIPLL